MTKSNNPPIKKLRDGSLVISIWANETEKGIRYTTDGITRSYTDGTGTWKDTRSLSNVEILQAARLMMETYDHIRDLKASDKETEA